MAVEMLTNLAFGSDVSAKLSAVANFPASPSVGELAFKNGILWIYSQAGGGSLTWYPLTNIENSYTHVQSSPSSVWAVNHNLATKDFVYQIFDISGATIIASIVSVDDDNCTVNFGEPVAGQITFVADADNYGMKYIDMGTM
jgi:hypothetical protein